MEKAVLKEDKISVSGHVKKLFKSYCKEQGVGMKEGLDEILFFIIRNKISLKTLDDLLDKNLTKEVFRYHNYTAGFLKEFEKRQLEVMGKIVGLVRENGSGSSEVSEVYMKEILVNTQFLMNQSPNQKLAERMIHRNDEALKKLANDNQD
ncbi:MAG: hypothetical protein J0M08_06855 [Bacteroidetes bacterium]|nr:hypothetical protein [Bacteroidota bacterium]